MRRWVRSSRPLSKRISRFLPSDSTAVISCPTTRCDLGTGPDRAARAAVTVRPTRYGRSPAAVRKRVSPSGIGVSAWPGDAGDARHEPAVAGDEPGLEQASAGTARRRRLAVDLADDQLADPAVGDERAQGARPRRPRTAGSSAGGQGLERRPAAFEVERRDRRRPARRTRRRRAGRPPVALARRGHGSAAPYGFAGSAAARSVDARPRRRRRAGSRDGPQPVERARQRELRRPEPVDEVAAPDPPGVLHRAQDRVDGAKPPAIALGRDRLAGQRRRGARAGRALSAWQPLGRASPARRRPARPATSGRRPRADRAPSAGRGRGPAVAPRPAASSAAPGAARTCRW